MTVYVAERYTPHENMEILGIFTSRVAAVAECERVRKIDDWDYLVYEVSTHTVQGAVAS